MSGPAAEIIQQFGSMESDQRYTRLLDLFADDAVYWDPFMGLQRGKDEIAAFMAHMEKLVPASGARFESWESRGDTHCGWARWTMAFSLPDGSSPKVPGQSLYRLRDGLVTGVVDYVDAAAYRALRGDDGPRPDADGASGVLRSDAGTGGRLPGGPALDLVRDFWAIQDRGVYSDLAPLFTDDATFADISRGSMTGIDEIRSFLAEMDREMPARGITFELIDAAGEDTVAWSQWRCELPGGPLHGWTLHEVRDGQFTLDADYFDTITAAERTHP